MTSPRVWRRKGGQGLESYIVGPFSYLVPSLSCQVLNVKSLAPQEKADLTANSWCYSWQQELAISILMNSIDSTLTNHDDPFLLVTQNYYRTNDHHVGAARSERPLRAEWWLTSYL
jgi:hypothetical protein